MARFYADIQGNRGEATRMGTKESGMEGHIRGWGIGAKVYMDTDFEDSDVVTVYITRGSSGKGESLFLGRYRVVDGNIVKMY